MKDRIAIIGSGIAGMSAAYYLRNEFDVSIFEKNSYIGGHTNTVTVSEGDRDIPIDTGFMVYNETTYPNLVRLFEDLNVITYNTSMSFGVQNRNRALEYSSDGFSGFFAQKRNLLTPSHWRLYKQILTFFESADHFLKSDPTTEITLSEFAKSYNLGDRVTTDFILPMAGAIWSTPPEGIQSFPALPLLRFMQNHRMLGIGIQLQWKTVLKGSDQYKSKLLTSLPNAPRVNQSIASVSQTSKSASIKDHDGKEHHFDYVILATHANQALKLLESPTLVQKNLLSSFHYNRNKAILHTDHSVMPRNKRAWASWNILHKSDASGKPKSSTHYWMNSLQNLDTNKDYFVSIDYDGNIPDDKIKFSTVYEHPLFDIDSIQAQPLLPNLNTRSRIKFCGSYFRNGFHEDALWSSLSMVQKILKEKGLPCEFPPL